MREELWNGNRETLRGVFWDRNALIPFAWRSFSERRRRYPAELATCSGSSPPSTVRRHGD